MTDTVREQQAESAARDAKLEPGGTRRPARRIAAGRECDRAGKIRPVPSTRLSAGSAIRPADRCDFSFLFLRSCLLLFSRPPWVCPVPLVFLLFFFFCIF